LSCDSPFTSPILMKISTAMSVLHLEDSRQFASMRAGTRGFRFNTRYAALADGNLDTSLNETVRPSSW
jgi:hypothetical protein